MFLALKRKGQLADMDEVWRDQGTGGAVYLGNIHASSDRALLDREGITHVVNCTAELYVKP